MPPSPAFPETVRETMIWQLANGDVQENVLHYSVAAAATVTSDFHDSMVTQLVANYNSNLASFISTGCRLIAIITEDLRTTPYASFRTDLAINGGDSSDPLPAQLAAVISIRTTRAGRSGRGRVYCGGFCEDSNTAGSINAALHTALLAYGSGLADITTADSQDVFFGVLSRKLGSMAAFVGRSADSRWDVQRRRANRRLP